MLDDIDEFGFVEGVRAVCTTGGVVDRVDVIYCVLSCPLLILEGVMVTIISEGTGLVGSEAAADVRVDGGNEEFGG